MDAQQTLNWTGMIRMGADKLAEAGVASPLVDSRELAAKVRGVPGNVVMSGDAVKQEQLMAFLRLLQRRMHREPLQHILGTMWFRYLELEAKPGVFIARPETEMVAQAGIDFLKECMAGRDGGASGGGAAGGQVCCGTPGDSNRANRKARSSIEGTHIIAVDLFSGSGAIALAIATEIATGKNFAAHATGQIGERNTAGASFGLSPMRGGASSHAASAPELIVYGIEKDRVAYESAQQNNARYGSPVHFVCADALAPLPELYEAQLVGRAALVIANPPYVPPYHQLSPEVQADPAVALAGGGELGLDIPVATIRRAAELLAPGGALVMEHASEQATALRAAAAAANLASAQTGVDLTGAERWLYAEKPCP